MAVNQKRALKALAAMLLNGFLHVMHAVRAAVAMKFEGYIRP
jgi:hypothetical protein